MFRFLLSLLMLALITPASAANTLIAQPESDGYRLIITADQTPLITGNLNLDFKLVQANDGTPVPVSGMRLFLTAQGFAGPPSETIALAADPAVPNHFRSHKLYVADAGLWDLRAEVLFSDGTRRDFNAPLEVSAVITSVADTARIMLPLSLGVILVLGIAWRFWRRRP